MKKQKPKGKNPIQAMIDRKPSPQPAPLSPQTHFTQGTMGP
jgi:hypothetical protein